MHVQILGPGRLGRSLAILLRDAGHVVGLNGRGFRVTAGDVVLLTVPDREIASAALQVDEGLPVLHCSGATSLAPLSSHAEHGSLHPLMTFPGPEVGIPELAGVAAAVDGTPAAVALARTLATDLGLRPVQVPGDRRLYHAAAVMAGNFATVLLAEAGQVLAACGVDPVEARTMLAPLAVASLNNAVLNPRAALTGPVARGDQAVISAHRDALTDAGQDDALATYNAMVAAALRLIDQASP